MFRSPSLSLVVMFAKVCQEALTKFFERTVDVLFQFVAYFLPMSVAADLDTFEASVWADVVGNLPKDWFGPETAALLVAYCRHSKMAKMIDDELGDLDPSTLKTDEGLKRLDKLGTMRDKQTRVIVSLATKMRLTQQATRHPETAGTAKRSAESGMPKPWED